MLVLMVLVLAGCGANVSTSMTIDENFAGKRDITLTLDSSDVSEITGGMAGLETVAKDNIPKEMSYKLNGNELVFTINFTDINDYRAKVASIIAAGVTEEEKASEDELLSPVVTYERNDSPFKKGVIFKENFTSVDLLDWYREALRVANIINESESNWYETGTNAVSIEGVEYSNSSKFNVQEQENTCLSHCNVQTSLAVDGTIVRTITFSANQTTIEELSGKGCELESYLKALAGKDVEFEAVKDEDNGYTDYIFTITTDSAEELVKSTNAIMQNQSTKFSLETKIDEERPGIAHVTVDEMLDGSFYLDYSYGSKLQHELFIYNNSELISATSGESKITYSQNNGGISYYPNSSLEYKFEFDWKIEFEKINLTITPSGKEEIEVSFDCAFSEDLSDEMKQSAIERVKGFFDSEKYKETDDGISFSFSGGIAAVTEEINKLMAKADDNADITENPTAYFSVGDINDFEPQALFANGSRCNVSYDFTPLFGNANLFVDQNEGFLNSKYYQDVMTNDDGEYYIAASGSVAIYSIGFSWIMAIIAVVCLLVVVFGVIFGLKNLDEFKNYIKALKEKKAAAVPAQTVAKVEAPVQAPVEAARKFADTEIKEEVPQEVPTEEQVPETTYDEEDIL